MAWWQICSSKWCIHFSCRVSGWKEGCFYWLTGKGQSGGTPPPYGLLKMEWYFMWRNQNMPLTGTYWERRPSCTFDRRRGEKKKEGFHLETRAGSNLTFSLSFSWIPSWLIFPPTCGRHLIYYARKYAINDWRKAPLQKK